jgi:hypothetical protein|nr:MAG TPA: hypothetical protein [Caudoviricetes sp.]
MTKEMLIQRYRDYIATDAHLQMGVELGILSAEEMDALQKERAGQDGIVSRAEYEKAKTAAESAAAALLQAAKMQTEKQ